MKKKIIFTLIFIVSICLILFVSFSKNEYIVAFDTCPISSSMISDKGILGFTVLPTANTLIKTELTILQAFLLKFDSQITSVKNYESNKFNYIGTGWSYCVE